MDRGLEVSGEQALLEIGEELEHVLQALASLERDFSEDPDRAELVARAGSGVGSVLAWLRALVPSAGVEAALDRLLEVPDWRYPGQILGRARPSWGELSRAAQRRLEEAREAGWVPERLPEMALRLEGLARLEERAWERRWGLGRSGGLGGGGGRGGRRNLELEAVVSGRGRRG